MSADAPEAASSDRNSRLSALLARVALADQRAFEEVYRLTGAHLYAVVLRIVRDKSIAEEILQEAYVNVWHHAGTYDAARSQPFTWLTSIVRNRALDLKRRREIDTIAFDSGDDDTPDMEYPSDGPTPVEMLMSAAASHSVRDCVETLDGGARQAIALAFFHGFSHGELAAHLREPLGTVKSWVRRGLEKLRRCLEAAGAAE
jgi:RNA polymerase sigma-70 factor (ECF subfamily)